MCDDKECALKSKRWEERKPGGGSDPRGEQEDVQENARDSLGSAKEIGKDYSQIR